MRRIEAIVNDKKVALLKEDSEGHWTVFDYSNRQTYGFSIHHQFGKPTECGWTEQQARAFVLTYINKEATFKER